MRALLAVNPAATSTTARTKNVLVHALSADLDIEVIETTHRGHAIEIGRRAAAEGVDLLIALGGDGTVNECVNGLLENGPRPDGPALAVVPGGSTNVFARALGLPNDPVEATGQILDGLRENRRRSVGLSTADGRWFTFCAGMGLDAEIVTDVERRRTGGLPATGALFLRSGLDLFYRQTEREDPGLSVRLTRRGGGSGGGGGGGSGSGREETVTGLFMAIVQNTAPWTYLRNLPVNACPDASFDTGLDIFAMKRLRTLSTLRHARQILQPGARPSGSDIELHHDLPELTLWADQPTALQLDGEPVGERMSVRFVAHPNALSVVI